MDKAQGENLPKVILLRRGDQEWLITAGEGGRYGSFSFQKNTLVTEANRDKVQAIVTQSANSGTLLCIALRFELPYERLKDDAVTQHILEMAVSDGLKANKYVFSK